MTSDNIYFAAKEPRDAAAVLMSKANSWYNQLYNNGYLDRVQEMWLYYHGAHYTGPGASHRITFTGEQGELAQMGVNHIRNIAAHMITMITTNRPAFQARATNGDSKSLIQASLANSLLDYYMREKRLEKYLRLAVEYAVVLGSGYIKLTWNATSGEVYEFNEETQTPIYEGDVEFCNLSPYDVVFDTSKESSMDHDWVLCRSFKNKFDLAAKYPELEREILALQTKNELFRYRLDMISSDDTADVPVYEFYHRRTEAMPDGRYMLFLTPEVTLIDTPMPYRSLPVYRISPSDILGTPYGYTPMYDLLPLQEAVNSLYSSILTNQHTFAVQNIFVPRGADIQLKALSGGLNIIEGNQKPEPLNFTNTPAEVFQFLGKLEQQMETISGINSVTRGNPEASLKSGTALALVQSMSLQFMSGLQQQYVHLIEDVGTGLINMLKDFAAVPRIAVIAGETNQNYVQTEFSGDDLSLVNRVVVDVGNAAAKTTAGKLQMATDLIQYGVVDNPKDYFTVLQTGHLGTMVDDTTNELNLIKRENENMLKGIDAQAIAVDEHVMHIKKHKALLSDPTVRMQPDLTGRVLAHIQEHIELLRNTDPAMLSVLNQQPLGPAGGSAPASRAPAAPNQSAAPEGELQGPPPTGMDQQVNLPNMPQVDPNLLPNPDLQNGQG